MGKAHVFSLDAVEMNPITGVLFNRDPSLGGDHTSADSTQSKRIYVY
jgi:hypothetical protein